MTEGVDPAAHYVAVSAAACAPTLDTYSLSALKLSLDGNTKMRGVPRIARRSAANCGQSLSWIASNLGEIEDDGDWHTDCGPGHPW